MSAAVTVPSVSARTVAGPPPSSDRHEIVRFDVQPVLGLQPGQSLGAGLELEGHRTSPPPMCGEIADGLQVPLPRGGLGDGDGIGVVGR